MNTDRIIRLFEKKPGIVQYSDDYQKNYTKIFERRFSDISFVRQEAGVLHNSFEWVRGIYECVNNNDREQILKLLNQNSDIRYGVLAETEIRSNKDLVISLVVGIAVLAMSEHIIDTELAFTALDTSIQLIEEITENDEILPMVYASLFKLAELIEMYRQREYHYLVKKVKEYISQHFHEQLLVADMAIAIGVSEDYLSKVFRKTEGIRLKEFIQRERIIRSKNLLLYSDRNILEISNYMAFSSQSHFTSVFKKYTGKTPGEYRKENI